MVTLHAHRLRVIASMFVVLLLTGVTTSAPQTDNAALLYYQACLLYGQPDGTLEQMLTDFRDGKTASNEAIRKHVETNRLVVGYVTKAADLSHCDWGYDYSLGLDITLTHLSAIKRIAFLVVADARLSAEEGDYRTALDRCMAIHKMALHETDRMAVTYLVGVSLSALANRTIQDLLVGVSGDVEALNQLKTRLTQIQDAFPSLQYAMTQEGQVCGASIRKEKAYDVVRVMSEDEKGSDTDSAGARILAGDDAFFERNRAHWFNTIAGIVAVLDSKLPYSQTYAKLDQYSDQMTRESKGQPDATFTRILLPATPRIYLLTTRLQAHFDAVRVATDLYTIRARTGRLPDVLPGDAPRDPFSGESFVYEKADDHFTLRCQAKEETEKAETNQYEFKIRRD
jgi:hypothetical protein